MRTQRGTHALGHAQGNLARAIPRSKLLLRGGTSPADCRGRIRPPVVKNRHQWNASPFRQSNRSRCSVSVCHRQNHFRLFGRCKIQGDPVPSPTGCPNFPRENSRTDGLRRKPRTIRDLFGSGTTVTARRGSSARWRCRIISPKPVAFGGTEETTRTLVAPFISTNCRAAAAPRLPRPTKPSRTVRRRYQTCDGRSVADGSIFATRQHPRDCGSSPSQHWG